MKSSPPSVIVLIADGDAVWRSGQRVTAPGPDQPAETSARIQSPQFLPDGQRFLDFARGKPGLYLGSLASAESKTIDDVPSPAQYAAGHLLYTRGRTLMVRQFFTLLQNWLRPQSESR